jgi:hypothetical protein
LVIVNTMTVPAPSSRRAIALEIAARIGCDWRTVLRAINEGTGAIRTRYVREAVARELAARGIADPA